MNNPKLKVCLKDWVIYLPALEIIHKYLQEDNFLGGYYHHDTPQRFLGIFGSNCGHIDPNYDKQMNAELNAMDYRILFDKQKISTGNFLIIINIHKTFNDPLNIFTKIINPFSDSDVHFRIYKHELNMLLIRPLLQNNPF